jgi:hypothetical protein
MKKYIFFSAIGIGLMVGSMVHTLKLTNIILFSIGIGVTVGSMLYAITD